MDMNTHTWHCHNMWTAPKSEKLSQASKKPSGCTLHNCCSVAWGNWYRVSCFFVLADLYELQGLKLQVQQDNHHTILRPFGPSRPSWPSKVLKRLMFSPFKIWVLLSSWMRLLSCVMLLVMTSFSHLISKTPCISQFLIANCWRFIPTVDSAIATI